MRTFEITLPPGGARHLETDAEFLRCVASSGQFTVKMDGQTELRGFEAGLAYRKPGGGAIRRVELIDETGAANTVRLYAGADDVSDDRLVLGGALSATIDGGTIDSIPAQFALAQAGFVNVPSPQGTAALPDLMGGLARVVQISNLGSDRVFLQSDDQVGANSGLMIPPGGSVTVPWVNNLQLTGDNTNDVPCSLMGWR